MMAASFGGHVSRLDRNGWTLVQGVLSPQECTEARGALLHLWQQQQQQKPPLVETSDIMHNLYNRGEAFERVYSSEGGRFALRLARHFLGADATLCDIEGRVLQPPPAAAEETEQQPWWGRAGALHVDGSLTGPFQAYAPADKGQRITSHMLTLRSIWCLSAFNKRAGSTMVVSGSHQDPALPPGGPHGSAPEPLCHPAGLTVLEAEPGDVLLYSSGTYHGVLNPSPAASEPRLALLSGYSRSWLWKGFSSAGTPSTVPTPEVLRRAGDLAVPLFGLQAAVHPSRRQSSQQQAEERAAALLASCGGDVEQAVVILRRRHRHAPPLARL